MTTENSSVISYELSVPLWSELRRAMPHIAAELGTTVDQIHIMDHNAFPGHYMDTEYRDLPYKLEGYIAGMPYIQNRGIHHSGKCGHGIAYYKSREDENIRYAVYIQKGEWSDHVFVIVPRNHVYKLVRIGHRLTKKANIIKDAPILAEDILETVVDNTIGFLKNAKKIEKYGVKIKKGILLDGSPGNGKTMLCKYIQKLCTQRGYRWGVVTAADIDKAYSDKELTPLFQQWTMTFFDDIDVSYLNRKEGAGKMACSLLTAMDGMYEGGHLVRIFTTNETLDKLDDAFTRPGRIDNIITLEKPEAHLRRKLVTTVWPQEIVDAIDVDYLVDSTDGFSFAEVEAIRTYLVTWRIVCNGEWDLDRALDEFAARKKESRKKMGFLNEKPKRKKKSDEDFDDCCESPSRGTSGDVPNVKPDNSWR